MSIFHFKKFRIQQHDSAAKVGTDGVLLGAWAPVAPEPQRILDIGTGTGLIALMLAQRTNSSQILTIEKDSPAYLESKLNFESSPWDHRIQALSGDFRDFLFNQKFDLIVSNPPFYNDSSLPTNLQRSLARNTSSLSFEDLIYHASSVLEPTGNFCCVLPFKELENFASISRKYSLFPNCIMFVKGNKKTPFKRVLISLQRKEVVPVLDYLTIETARNQYTQKYIDLTQDFYLKM